MLKFKSVFLIFLVLFFSLTAFAFAETGDELNFVSKEVKEYKEKNCSYKINYPKFTGYENKVAENNLNQKIYSVVLDKIKKFNEIYNGYGDRNCPNPYVRIDMNYELRNRKYDIVSLKFTSRSCIGGTAHPLLTSLNYDLSRDRVIELSDLFQSSYYLNIITNHCNIELKKRFKWLREWKLKEKSDDGIEFHSDGTRTHYGEIEGFNMTGDSLIIMVGYVGCMADGPQEIVIPYSDLKDILDPDGPAGYYFDNK